MWLSRPDGLLRFGLKGQLDATLRVEVTRKEKSGSQPFMPSKGRAHFKPLVPAVQASTASYKPHPHSSGCSVPTVLASSTSNASSTVSSWCGKVVRRGGAAAPSGSCHGQGSGGGGNATEEVTRSMLVPFEFKSGKEYMGHRGQVW
jgi:hypothetical protein